MGASISKAELGDVKDEVGHVIDIGIVRYLTRNKSAGPDGWPYEFIQLLVPIIGEATVAELSAKQRNGAGRGSFFITSSHTLQAV